MTPRCPASIYRNRGSPVLTEFPEPDIWADFEADYYFPLTAVHRRYSEIADEFARARTDEQRKRAAAKRRNVADLMIHDRPGQRRTDAHVTLGRPAPEDWMRRLLNDIGLGHLLAS